MEIKALKPTFSRRLQSRMAVQRAPDWLMKPRVPGLAMVLAKVALRPGVGHHHPQAVGANQAHLAFARLFEHLAFEFDARRAGFLEAGRNNDRARDACGHTFADETRDGGGRGGDDGQVHLLGHGGDIGVGLDAEHAGAFGIDRIHGALESPTAHVGEDRAPDAPLILSCADNGDGFGRKDGIERLPPDLVQDVVGRLGPLRSRRGGGGLHDEFDLD